MVAICLLILLIIKVNSAKDIIQKVCTNYKYNDFFENRIKISDDIS